jgi:hypothetical protein
MFDDSKWHFLLNCNVKRTGNGNGKYFVYGNWNLHRVRHVLEVFHSLWVGHRHMHIYTLLSHDRIVEGDFSLKIYLTLSSSTILLQKSHIFFLSICTAFPRIQLHCLLSFEACCYSVGGDVGRDFASCFSAFSSATVNTEPRRRSRTHT